MRAPKQFNNITERVIDDLKGFLLQRANFLLPLPASLFMPLKR